MRDEHHKGLAAMDSLRGHFADGIDLDADARDYDPAEDETGHEAPPGPVGQDERRMQVRAYNHWAGLLGNRHFPAVEDLYPESLDDFGPYSVLLDFTSGIENPGIAFLGPRLARECGADGEISRLSDIPSRSLLSRITDHYMQILANQAPIGFEAEFVNQRGQTILYRGILLPFSSDNDTIDFIFGVINWKELADQFLTDELLLEIDQALDQDAAAEPAPLAAEAPLPEPLTEPLTDWADGPAAEGMDEIGDETAATDSADDILDLSHALVEEDAEEDSEEDGDAEPSAMPESSFGKAGKPRGDGFASLADMLMPKGLRDTDTREDRLAGLADAMFLDAEDDADAGYPDREAFLPQQPLAPAPADDEPWHEPEAVAEPDEADAADMGLGDWLASARELAETARTSEDRTRQTLYAAIGRAYDFSLAAQAAPEEFTELVADFGLKMQDRAPMTPVVKLVFGADYDKTRLTEYAAALSHGHRLGIERGGLASFLGAAKGGLKAVVAAERRLRREENGQFDHDNPQEKLAQKLRELEPVAFDAIEPDGAEFALVMIRRLETGEVVILGEVPEDIPLLERAARKLVG